MAKKPLPTPEVLRQLLDYDPETGALTWKPRPAHFFSGSKFSAEHASANWNSRWAGKPAFTANTGGGYLHGSVLGSSYRAHRVIWALTHGEWPECDIDHINHNRSDNRLVNLRAVDRAENLRNSSKRSDNTSGVNGVYRNKRLGKWQAYIRAEGKMLYLGVFEHLSDAVLARKKADAEFGFHRNHGT